ncbi:MAG: hypothetical protein ACLUPF_13425 [Dorea sp.]
MRDFETWVIYPVTIGQLLQMTNNGKSPQGKCWGFRAKKCGYTEFTGTVEKARWKLLSAERLLECDALPKGAPLCLYPEQVAAYAKELQNFAEKVSLRKL